MGLRPRIARDRGNSMPHHLTEEQTRHLLGYDGQPGAGHNGDDPWEVRDGRAPMRASLLEPLKERPGTVAVVTGIIIAIVIAIAGGGERHTVKRQAAPATARAPASQPAPRKPAHHARRHRPKTRQATTVASATPAPALSASQKRRPCRAHGAGVKAAQVTTTAPATTNTTTEPPPSGGRETTSPDSSATGGTTTPTTTTQQPGATSHTTTTPKSTRKRSPSRRHSTRAPCGR
jgi:hypothetical protein